MQIAINVFLFALGFAAATIHFALRPSKARTKFFRGVARYLSVPGVAGVDNDELEIESLQQTDGSGLEFEGSEKTIEPGSEHLLTRYAIYSQGMHTRVHQHTPEC